MKRFPIRPILVVVGVVLVLAVGALVIIPQLIPSDVYRERIEATASESLGRKVTVSGDIRLSVFPRIVARAGATTIANPEGFGDAPFASMNELRAVVKLIPLLFSRVEIDQFILVEPNIGLVSLENGDNNWTFVSTAPPAPPRPAPPTEAPRRPPTADASLGDVRIINGRVSWEDRAAGQSHTLSELNMRANMRAMDKPFSINAVGLANELPFKIDARITNPKALFEGATSDVVIALDTDLMRTKVDGGLSLGELPAFDFKFEADIPSAVELADAFQVADLPARDVLGRISAKGRAFGNAKDITLAVEDARHTSGLLNADFNGEMRVADFVTLNIEAKADAPRLADLAAAMDIESPGPDILGKASATTKISGALGDLRFTDVAFRHDSGLLAIGFDGAARLHADLTYNGAVSIAAPDLRRLATAAGAKLPGGDIYRSFSLTGETSGSTRDLRLRNAVLEFDSVRGTGEAALNFGGAKPKLVGTLSTNLIDITPYALASGAPEEKDRETGWGRDPIDLTPLRLADADLSINAQGVTFQKFDFGPSNLAVALTNGRLTADLRQTSLFGGAGGAKLVADGSGATPSVALTANIKGLGLKPLLGAAAGFDMLDGLGDLQIDAAGAGGTLDAMMASLVGGGTFSFKDGLLSGVDLNELGRSAQTALTTRSIPVSAFGANASTQFRALNASFSMKDGVAAMADMKLDSDLLSVTGGGSLDIGKQTLSLSLYPEYKNTNSGVKGYGLPIKLAGGWNGVRMSLDFDWLVQRAASDARARLTSEVENELRNQLGDRFSGVLGLPRGGASQPAPEATPAPPPAQADGEEAPAETPAQPQAQPERPEDRLRREAERALGGLLRRD